ncbi:hypothetical protein NEOLEDRAFT_1067998 [Neolentinus lepideus HHB14362 ss-1]|uniref:DUF647-domain-containing protein n=1 Tax=Neolentinus lepideus HHB14362 ss-1 TaxID=1314782 RepID=A0A165RR12_9AGAM|nr:hypothetical protein NEOLEDRAFT_1067998 [Neolentinus lepideus HHB14362 ss-1]
MSVKRYQAYNALQAFFSSLASLIASRAVLEGHGVGDPSASATDAMILTIIQDVFSRLSTILGAYYFGTSLFPEAKTYRFLADILNDAAILLDSISPLLVSGSFPFALPRSSLRVASLCLSGACRALCGIVAGGSKTALTIHFAEDGKVPGDIGDLNAKDGSRETVLSLLGMLSGTFVLRYLSTPVTTYLTLFVLIAGHLTANYVAVRAVAMHTLNCQRTSHAWLMFHKAYNLVKSTRAPSPEQISSLERILVYSGAIRNNDDSKVIGFATFESSFSRFLPPRSSQEISSQERLNATIALHREQRYLILTDAPNTSVFLKIRIFLKDGYGPLDKLRAWVHAVEIGSRWRTGVSAAQVIESAYRIVDDAFPIFVEKMKEAGWNVDEGLLSAGPSGTISIYEGESKKKS